MGLTRQQIVMVAVLLSGTLLAVLNQTLLSPALPAIMADLQVNATTVQWLTSGYSLVEAIIIPLSAWFIGRFRTRQLFVGGLLVFAAGSLLGAVAPAFPLLLVGRMLQAAATGVLMPMVMTLILLTFPREKRGAGMGLVSLVISFAPAIGPSVSGLLVDSVGWRALFVIVAVLTVIIILVASKALRDYEGFSRSKLDVASVALISLGMATFLYGLSTFTSAENHLATAALVVAGIVLVALFVRRQLALDEPLLRVQILKSVRYRTVVIALFFLQAAFIGMTVIIPLYIQNVLGNSATVSGLVVLPGAVLGAIAGLLAGRMFDRYGVRGVAVAGSALLFLASVGMTFFQIDSSIVLVCAVYTVFAFSMQLIMTPLNTWGLNSLDNSVIQHANALTNTLNQVGGSFGTALIVSLTALGSSVVPEASADYQVFMGDHIAFIATAVLLGIVFAIVVLFVRNRKGAAAPAADRAPVATGAEPAGAEPTYVVADIMNRDSLRIPAGSSLADAISLFTEAQTDGAPIVEADGRAVGFLSGGDIMRYLGDETVSYTNSSYSVFDVFGNEDIESRVNELLLLDVSAIATKKVLGVEPDMPLERVCTMFAERKLKKLPVLVDGKVVGVISRRNIMNAIRMRIL